MTSVALEFPEEDDDKSAGKRRTPDDMFPELTAKHKEQREMLARMVEMLARFEDENRRREEGRGGR